MYNFHDLEINQRYEPEYYPSEDLVWGPERMHLSIMIPGFRVLYTTGRDEYSREINATNRVGDGATFLSSRLETRKIEVVFLLTSKNIAEFNQRVTQLKENLFSKVQTRFGFADDPSHHYTGTVTGLTFDSPTLETKGKIEISLQDPYRYGETINLTGTGTAVTLGYINQAVQTTPNYLDLKLLAGTSNFKVTNGNKVLTFNAGLQANDHVHIDFQQLTFDVNSQNRLSDVALSSNLGDFFLTTGAVSWGINANYVFNYEVKAL